MSSAAPRAVKPTSDLDLAVEFFDVDEADAELICNARAWKAELTRLTSITVKDLYHRTAEPVANGAVMRVFSHQRAGNFP